MNPSRKPSDGHSDSAAETRRALIDAARQVFAEDGYAGARVSRIAELAGVNKALINYHFRGKANLLRAVIDDFAGRLVTGLREQIDTSAPAERQLRQFIRFMAGKVARNPEFPRILLFESTSVEGAIDNPPEHLLRVIGTLKSILEKGRDEGVFPAVNPFFAHFHIMSSFAMFHLSRPLRERFKAARGLPPEVFSTEAFERFVEEQVVAGLKSMNGDRSRERSEFEK